MQHKQFNFVRRGTKIAVLTWAFLAVGPALGGSIVQPSRPDPLLDSGPTTPCAAGVDYAAGVDANGQPVVPADVAAGPVPLPDTIAIPIARNGISAAGPTPNFASGRRSSSPINPDNASNRDNAYIALDGRKLEPLLNPQSCAPVH